MDSESSSPRCSGLRALPRSVWALGFVSLLMDTSSELIHSLLPVFMVSTLGVGALAVGLVEGGAEAAAMITRVFSGVLSDYLGRRKLLAVLGYGLAALTKPLFPLAGSLGLVVAARLLDRVGKGIRGAPRDALVADVTPLHLRGRAYGLRQGLDTIGAVAGPLLAMLFMVVLTQDIRAVFWIAVLPALAAVAVLALFVREPQRGRSARPVRSPVHMADLRHMGQDYWRLVGVAVVLALARFSEAFLVLRASGLGLSPALVPVVMVVMSAVYSLSAYPAGAWSDRVGRRRVFAWGLLALVVADLVLAWAPTIGAALLGVGLWGLHMGLSQGLLAAMVADCAPERLRGTAFGVFNLSAGVAMLAASVLAGGLWDRFGPGASFGAGAGFALLALLGVWRTASSSPAGPA